MSWIYTTEGWVCSKCGEMVSERRGACQACEAVNEEEEKRMKLKDVIEEMESIMIPWEQVPDRWLAALRQEQERRDKSCEGCGYRGCQWVGVGEPPCNREKEKVAT